MNRPTNKQLGWGIVAVAAILATLFFGVNYPVPPAPVEQEPAVDVVVELESRSLSRPVQMRDVRILQNLDVDGDATVGDDLTVTDDITAGDMTLSGGLTVTGGVTGTNVLTTGDQTVAGIKTFSTAIAVGAVTGPVTLTGPTAVATATPAAIVNNLGAANNSFEVRDAATPVFVVGQAGVWTHTGVGTLAGWTSSAAANVTAPTAVATATPAFMVDSSGAGNVLLEVRDAATPVFQVLNGGSVLARGNYLAKTANYTITTADSGSTIRTTNAITLTLPGAAAGLQYCIVNGDGNDIKIDPPDATDYVLVLSNSGGDRVTNTTVGDFLCLFGIDATNWVALGRQGTWSDGD